MKSSNTFYDQLKLLLIKLITINNFSTSFAETVSTLLTVRLMIPLNCTECKFDHLFLMFMLCNILKPEVPIKAP